MCAGGVLTISRVYIIFIYQIYVRKYLSNKCHIYIYMYVLKKDGRPESAKH